MNVTRESDSPTEVTLSILMDSVDEEPYLNRSYRRVVSRLQIPGFRPGKAPRSIVESHVGRTALVQEALEFMIPESLDKVLKEQDIKAFAEKKGFPVIMTADTHTRALDRVLQWGHYVLPLYHLPADRLAYWNKFGRPGATPESGYRLDTWWEDPAKASALTSR